MARKFGILSYVYKIVKENGLKYHKRERAPDYTPEQELKANFR